MEELYPFGEDQRSSWCQQRSNTGEIMVIWYLKLKMKETFDTYRSVWNCDKKYKTPIAFGAHSTLIWGHQKSSTENIVNTISQNMIMKKILYGNVLHDNALHQVKELWRY